MNDDRILEFMASVSEYMRSTDQRFAQMITVMHDGFERVTGQIGNLTNEVRATNERVDKLTEEVRTTNGRIDRLTTRVDYQTSRVDYVASRVEYLTDGTSAIRRRVDATFDQTGRLTEQNSTKEQRLHQLKTEELTNAELNRRIIALEEFMQRAS